MHQQTKMTAAPRPPLSETQRKRRSLPTSEASDRIPRGASSGTRSPAVLDAVVPKVKAFGAIGEASEAWGKKSAKPLHEGSKVLVWQKAFVRNLPSLPI